MSTHVEQNQPDVYEANPELPTGILKVYGLGN